MQEPAAEEGLSEISSDETDALRARGNAAYQAGNLAEARKLYSHAISLDPSGASAHKLHSNLSAVHASLKEWDLSLLHASKSVNLDPDFAKGWPGGGGRERRVPDASQTCPRPRRWSRMGAAYEQLEQLIKSVGAYRLCLLLDPGNINAARAVERLEPSAGTLCSAGAAAAVSGGEAFDKGDYKSAVAFLTAAIATLGGHFCTDTAAQLFCDRSAAHASDNNFSLVRIRRDKPRLAEIDRDRPRLAARTGRARVPVFG